MAHSTLVGGMRAVNLCRRNPTKEFSLKDLISPFEKLMISTKAKTVHGSRREVPSFCIPEVSC